MRENRFFVRSTDLTGDAPAQVDGAPAIQSYGRLIDRLEAIAGLEAAALFAEPVLPRGAAGSATAVSWYSASEGAVAEVDAIDEVARKPIAERLAQRLGALAPVLNDREIGPAVSTWLNVGSPRDILSVGGEPVLVNWGFLPADKAADLDKRREHFAQTLGRFAPQLALPPVEARGPVDADPAPAPAPARDPPVAAAAASAVTPGASAVAASVPAPPPAPPRSLGPGGRPPVGPPAGPPRGGEDPPPRPRPWLAPMVATAVAALVLVLLLLPGVLVYPSTGNAARDAFEADRLRASNESLETQLKALQDVARERVCRVGDPVIPVPDANSPDKPGPAPQMELVPRAPERVPVPPNATDAGAANLAELLEGATVLIIAFKPPDSSQGSGFFIDERHIVTNHHVVEDIDPRLVFVASKALGGTRHARIVARSEPPPREDDLLVDLAILEIDPGPTHPALKLGVTPPKLSTAYVAGFPGFLIQKDSQFQQFVKGLVQSLRRGEDPDRALPKEQIPVPGADMRSGRINNMMNSGSKALPILVHDMQLAPGNSGGPLVDACGRLSGVNTLLFTTDKGSQQGNVAQDVSIVRKFLDEQHVAYQGDDAPCRPPSAAPPPVASAPPETKK